MLLHVLGYCVSNFWIFIQLTNLYFEVCTLSFHIVDNLIDHFGWHICVNYIMEPTCILNSSSSKFFSWNYINIIFQGLHVSFISMIVCSWVANTWLKIVTILIWMCFSVNCNKFLIHINEIIFVFDAIVYALH